MPPSSRLEQVLRNRLPCLLRVLPTICDTEYNTSKLYILEHVLGLTIHGLLRDDSIVLVHQDIHQSSYREFDLDPFRLLRMGVLLARSQSRG